MFFKKPAKKQSPSEFISRKDVIENILTIFNCISHGITDSEALQHWHGYLENLTYKIQSVISETEDETKNIPLQSFQLCRICDFLGSIDKQDFAGAIYEIYTILNVHNPDKSIGREELILIYLLLVMALSQFQVKKIYSMKPLSSNKPIALK